ncbi:MAG: phosphonoacetaldehyde hydrolase, partial [Chloroflexi bacterium]|nr:phosphonoacetaldehyde hydrolase [Chloroflexota bacterium]
MSERIRLVIFDWAGTTVDHGCFAPVAPFVEALRRSGVAI